MVANDTNLSKDIFVRDLVNGTTQRVSITKRINITYNNFQANDDSYNPEISNNGRYVVFESDADNLVYGYPGSYDRDIFVRDLVDNTISLVSIANGNFLANGSSYNPDISADGRYVVFESYADNLVDDDNNGYPYTTWKDIFVRDLVNNTTQRVNIANDGSEANGGSVNPYISANGRYVVFQSAANNLVSGDTNGSIDIFVRDLVNNTTQRVNVANDAFGTQANGDSENPTISANGRYVFFESYANNLVSGDTNGSEDIFVRDLLAETTDRVSVTNDPDDSQANGWSSNYSISADGRYLAFGSSANNLAYDDDFYSWDLFLRDRGSLFSDPIASIPVIEDDDLIQDGSLNTPEDDNSAQDGSLNTPEDDNSAQDGSLNTPEDVDSAQDPFLNTPIYRFQSLNTSGTYLYAAGAEAENIRKNFASSFVEEGMAFNTAIEPHEQLIPLFRFQSNHLPGTYLFVREDERNSINANPNLSNSFTEEGIGFYVYGAGSQKGATFSRFQNANIPGTYLYATGAEADNIRKNFPNFIEEGPAFEVVI